MNRLGSGGDTAAVVEQPLRQGGLVVPVWPLMPDRRTPTRARRRPSSGTQWTLAHYGPGWSTRPNSAEARRRRLSRIDQAGRGGIVMSCNVVAGSAFPLASVDMVSPPEKKSLAWSRSTVFIGRRPNPDRNRRSGTRFARTDPGRSPEARLCVQRQAWGSVRAWIWLSDRRRARTVARRACSGPEKIIGVRFVLELAIHRQADYRERPTPSAYIGRNLSDLPPQVQTSLQAGPIGRVNAVPGTPT